MINFETAKAHVTRGKVLPKEIADKIVDRTDGVPLFIEELTKTIVESGMLTEAGDRYAITGPVPPLAIPMTLHASLLARLDRLAPTREVAQIGAALGRQFSHELISAVATMPKQQLDDALAQLVDAELIFRRGTPPDAEYTFKHALVQDATYSTLLRTRRLQLHAGIATTLEDHFPEIVVAQPALLAQHCAEAQLTDKAVGYWLKAGQRSVARSAMTEAVAQLKKGLELVGRLPGAQRQEKELEFQITLGQALVAAQGHGAPESGEAFARARQLCESLECPSQLGPILTGQWLFRFVRGELEQADKHVEEIRELGEALNDSRCAFFSSTFGGLTRFRLGKFVDARIQFDNALSLWDPAHRAFTATPDDPYLQASLHHSRTLICLGYVHQASLWRDNALAEARRLSLYNLAFALFHAWVGDWAMENVQAVQRTFRSAEEVLVISGERGLPMMHTVGNIMQGWCLGSTGRAQ